MRPPAGRPESVATSALTSGSRLGSSSARPSRSMSGAAFTSALSAMPGIEAWPLRPKTRTTNGAVIFSATPQR